MSPQREIMPRVRRALVLGLCATLLAAEVVAKPPEPTGFGKLTFGMGVAEVKKIHPKMEELPLERNLGVSALGGPHVNRFLLPKQKVEGAPQPVDVEIRFWKGKLWMINVYFGVANDPAVMTALTKQYGPPTSTNAQTSAWIGQNSALFVEHAPGQYTIQEMAMMKEAQAYVLDLLRQGRQAEVLPADTARNLGSASLPAAAPTTAPTAAPTANPTAGVQMK